MAYMECLGIAHRDPNQLVRWVKDGRGKVVTLRVFQHPPLFTAAQLPECFVVACPHTRDWYTHWGA